MFLTNVLQMKAYKHKMFDAKVNNWQCNNINMLLIILLKTLITYLLT